jgi:alkanesulfonate monooxygenase SsuD/methylene tetrahydromethanopterin reductase-like flavin-dependent oxidoreductase (luciferase family)
VITKVDDLRASVTAAAPTITENRERWGLERFEIGIALGGANGPDEWARDLAAVDAAEQHGLHSVWVPEMHFARGVTASPLTALAAFAARTTRIRLATTSVLLPIHDPRVLADEVAALDRMSRGRVILGLGRGFRTPLFRAFGIDPKTKRDLFDNCLDAMLSHWEKAFADEASGLTNPVDREDGLPRVRAPWQAPHPPLTVAAFGPLGLAQAARRGLPYLPSPLESATLLERNLAAHRSGLPEGFDAESLVVPVMRTVHVAPSESDASGVLERLGREARAMASSGPRPPKALAAAAAEDIADRVVVGTVAEVTDALGALREQLGMDLLIARTQISGLDAGARSDALSRLVEDVWPALR